MTRWLLALCVLAASTVLLAADEKKDADDKGSAKYRVISLAIHKAPPEKPGGFIRPNGIRMEVMLWLPKRFILGVKAAKLDRFTDDKNNSLYQKGKGAARFNAPKWLTEFGMLFAPDGESVTFESLGNK